MLAWSRQPCVRPTALRVRSACAILIFWGLGWCEALASETTAVRAIEMGGFWENNWHLLAVAIAIVVVLTLAVLGLFKALRSKREAVHAMERSLSTLHATLDSVVE